MALREMEIIEDSLIQMKQDTRNEFNLQIAEIWKAIGLNTEVDLSLIEPVELPFNPALYDNPTEDIYEEPPEAECVAIIDGKCCLDLIGWGENTKCITN